MADTEDGPSRLDRMLQVGEIISSIANAELANALNEKNKDWRKLKRALELKDGQIASLEEARKKDSGELSLLSSHPTSNQHV